MPEMLSEHQPIPDVASDAKTQTDYQPDEAETALIKKCDKMFEKSKKHKRAYDENWLENYQIFRGRQWKEQRPAFRHSEVINMVFQAIQSTIPLMTDSKPRISFLPQEPSDMALAEILNKVSDADWTKNNWIMALTEVCYDGEFYGTAFSSQTWCSDEKKIIYQSEDPFYCFPDPNSRDVNTKSRFFIHAEPTDLSVIKSNPKWKAKSQFVKSDLMDMKKNDRTDLGEPRFVSPTDVDMLKLRDGPGEFDNEKALVVTCYWKCDSFDETKNPRLDAQGMPVTDEMGVPQVDFIQKLKYPNGRKTVYCSNVVLEDEPLEYDDGQTPFARYLNYILPREFWGQSEVEQLKGPQRAFNKILSFALDVLTIMGNPIWVVDNDSGIDTDELINRPGLIVEKNKGSEARREPGVELQPYVLQLIDRLEQWFQGVSGSTDVSQGIRPEGITAASAIQELKDSSQTRIRQKSRNLDCYLQNVGQQYASRVFQYYDAPRVFRITNDQNVPQFFQFHISTDEQGNKFANVRDLNTDGTTPIDSKQYQIKGEFDVVVTTGSSLPFAKKEKYSVAKELFQLGVIDDEELLKAADYPNAEQVLARNAQKKAQAAQTQALQGGKPSA